MINENNYINTQIGNYRIISELANGASGRVYLAQHTVLVKRTVAIKLLHVTHLGSPEERADFLREAQFLEELKHPYILPIYDVGIEDGGFPYIVAEYAPNGSLRDRIKSRAPHLLPFQEVLTILSQIGQALHYAHQRQIIHRDLKPENILFNARNEALLADFGLATSLSTLSMKQVGSAGTPRYMAPEQFRGNVSKESDQYCLACIAYELVTGRPPFLEKEFYAIGFKHLTENPTPPTQLNPYLPVTVEHVILKAMAKQRTDRFPDISSFISALLQATDSQAFMLASSEIEMPTLSASSTSGTFASEPKPQIPGLSDTNSPNITEPGRTEIDRNQTILDTGLLNQTPGFRKSNSLTPPLQKSGPLTPLPVAPLHDVSTVYTGEFQSPITSNTPMRANLRNVEDNTAFLPPGGWEARNHRPARGGSAYRWAFLTVLCLALGAGIMAVLLLGIIPMFSSHNESNSAGSSQQARATVSSTATSSKPSQHSTPKRKPTGQPTATSTGRNTPNSTPQAKSSPTGQPTAHATPNVTPTAPTPTPTPPPTTETLTVDFTNPNSIQTAYSYSGVVTVTVSGEGGVSQLGWSDAFYEYDDFSGNPLNPPQHTRCWVMYIDGQQSDLFVSTPPYNPSHSYQFTMIASGIPINFGICDNTRSDDHGALSVTVTGNAISSSVTSVASTSDMQVKIVSTDMMAEESKKN